MAVMDCEPDTTTPVHTFYALHAFEGVETKAYYPALPDDVPMPGEVAHNSSDWHADWHTGEKPVMYLCVPGTFYGLYATSSTYERANLEALLRDYPDTFVHLLSDPDAQELLLPFTARIDEHMQEILLGLREGLYDEEYLWELEQRLCMDWWDSDGRDEFREILGDLLHPDGEESVFDDFQITDEWVGAEFWRNFQRGEWDFTVDGPDSVFIETRTLERVATTLATQVVADWNARVTWLADRQEGLFS